MLNLEDIMNQDGLSGGQCHCVLDFGCCRHWGGAEEGLDDGCVLCRQAVPKWWGIHVSRWCHSNGRAPGQATPGMGYWGRLIRSAWGCWKSQRPLPADCTSSRQSLGKLGLWESQVKFVSGWHPSQGFSAESSVLNSILHKDECCQL